MPADTTPVDGVKDSSTTESVLLSNRWTGVQSTLSAVGRILFGDRIGFLLFVGALLFYGLYWRIGFFINDTTLYANTLVNVAEGRLALLETPYSLTVGSQPGAVVVDGQPYGRNYGHVFLAVPLLWLLEIAALVSELRVVIAAGWSLLLVVFARQLAIVFERDWIGGLGALTALLVFVVSVSVATSLPRFQEQMPLELLALQLSTMLAAGMVGVVLYRLVMLFHGPRVGTAAGAGLVLATPVSFWASIPKRHVVTAAVVVVTLYCFAVSRQQGRHALLSRGVGYSAIGLLALVHSFEAIFVLLVFVPIDVLTAPSRSVRSSLFVGGVFLLSLLPLFVVNTLISGNPLRPPRLLEAVPDSFNASDTPGAEESPSDGGAGEQLSDGQSDDGGQTGGQSDDGGQTDGQSDGGGQTDGQSDGGDQTSGQSDGGTTAVDGEPAAGGSDGGSVVDGIFPWSIVPAPLVRGLEFSTDVVGLIYWSLARGVGVAKDFDRVYHTLIRSGFLPDFVNDDLTSQEAIDLALLEASPLIAALCWLPIAAARRFRATVPSRFVPATPEGQTDLLAAGYVIVLTLVYLPVIPRVFLITVRYLIPIVPLLLYGVVRLAVVRDAVDAHPRVLAGSYGTAVMAGGVALLAVLVAADPAVGEAMQLHALLGLATAAVGAGAVLTSPLHNDGRVVAAGLAVPAAATTLFLLFTGTIHFQYGPFALDIVGEAVNLLP